MLTWDKNDERYFHHGLDRGVLYPSEVPDPVEVGRNLFPNPDAVDATSWTTSGITMSFNGGWITLTPNSANADSNIRSGGDTGGLRLGLEPGKTYTVSATVDTPVAQSGTLNNLQRCIAVFTKVGSNNYVSVLSEIGPVTGTKRLSLTFTVPTGASEAFIRFYNGASLGNGVVRWKDFLLEVGSSLNPFYSGDTVDELNTYSWAGTRDNSQSIKKAKVGTAIPWNGITGMDEAGNGSSAIYYIDGKVFLADVDATDFSGKLSAYSWPDAFSKALGFPEAADGLYVDNQKPKQFGFSYRSLIGSGLSGDQFGYQIHLVYKAMASFNGRSRKTINNSPGPMEFGFDLVCTPVALPGYRPSAHYIIDTRHLSKTTVDQLEGILYGDATHAPRMPTPTELYDLLNFGSAITFVKFTHPVLGECWTASGSFANVHYTGDGSTFEILNVNGTDLGNGQYQLSDTP